MFCLSQLQSVTTQLRPMEWESFWIRYADVKVFLLLLLRGDTVSLWTWTANRPIVHPAHDIWVNMEQRWNDTDERKPKDSEKSCLSATLSTTNPIWTDLSMKPGLRGEKPATNRLSYGTATSLVYKMYQYWLAIWARRPARLRFIVIFLSPSRHVRILP
jgi:hypothetical protein